jgi:hypothetical protein
VGRRAKTVSKLKGVDNPNEPERYTDKDGYVHVKKENGYWPLEHHVVWKEKNGNVPNGHIIKFIDGNKLNTKIENLVLVKRKGNTKKNIPKNNLIIELENENNKLKSEIEELKNKNNRLEKDNSELQNWLLIKRRG